MHIPDPHEKTTIFYGWYSNWTRGYRKLQGLLGAEGAVEAPPVASDRAPREVRRSWARGQIPPGWESRLTSPSAWGYLFSS
ncbi:MAG TPA: hypothetical protein VLT62_23010 [Candidatus Methylomirabilis sp.]|nr:hypothetical protein [Candidatus Methylomirabilis sp.]